MAWLYMALQGCFCLDVLMLLVLVKCHVQFMIVVCGFGSIRSSIYCVHDVFVHD